MGPDRLQHCLQWLDKASLTTTKANDVHGHNLPVGAVGGYVVRQSEPRLIDLKTQSSNIREHWPTIGSLMRSCMNSTRFSGATWAHIVVAFAVKGLVC